MMAELPRCRCGGQCVIAWNQPRQCWDAICDRCPAGFWGMSKILAQVEWGRAMRRSTYVLEAEPIELGMKLGE